MFKEFFKCGSAGICMEVFWTGISCIFNKDYRISGTSSILMFPIYGMAALIKPAYRFLRKLNVLVRGSIYTILIFIVEYCSGSFLKKHHMCPWDYSKSKLNINGLVRLDYAPVWFFVGLLFEKILNPIKSCSHAHK